MKNTQAVIGIQTCHSAILGVRLCLLEKGPFVEDQEATQIFIKYMHDIVLRIDV